MSVRDEMAEMLYGDAWNSVRAQRDVSSIMPIVERVALNAVKMGWQECRIYEACGRCKSDEAMVKKLMEGGQ